jgi:hypothetical protein
MRGGQKNERETDGKEDEGMTAEREIFEKVGKYLYKRQYQTADGQARVMFYAIFTDWKRKRRKFPLGSNLEDAEDALGELKIRNKGRYDFDTERKEREKARIKAIRLSQWLDRYLGLVKGMASGEIKRSQCSHLKRLLGHLPLTQVTRIRIME